MMSDIDSLNADFAKARPEVFARTLSKGQTADVLDVLNRLPRERVASIAARLSGIQILTLLETGGQRFEGWLAASPFDDAVALLSRVPRERRLSLINAVADRKRRQQLLRQQRYPSHSVGALVRDVAVRISADTTVAQTLETLARFDQDPGPIAVVDADGRFVGGLDWLRLATKPAPARRVSEYTVNIETILPETPIAVAAERHVLSAHTWLPVVDHQGRILGSVARAALVHAVGADLTANGETRHLTIDLMNDAIRCLASLLDMAFGRRNRA